MGRMTQHGKEFPNRVGNAKTENVVDVVKSNPRKRNRKKSSIVFVKTKSVMQIMPAKQ